MRPEGNERSKYNASLLDVFSGDDIVVMVDLGTEDLYKRQRVRLHGVDTPNGLNRGADTPAGKVRTSVRKMLTGRPLQVEVVSRGANSWVAIVYIVVSDTETINLNEELANQGFVFKDRG